MTLRRALTFLLAGVLLGLWPGSAFGAPGDRDTTFGDHGVVVTDLSEGTIDAEDYAADVTTDSSGRVVLAGHTERNNQTESDAVVIRYTSAGALDPTFGGGDGIVSFHFGAGSFDSLAAVAVDSSGRIVVVGSTESDISCTTFCHPAIARLTSSSQLDPTFGGGDGIVTLSAEEGNARSVVIDSSGRIDVATGSAVYRFTESGALDSSFGHLGRAPLAAGAFAGMVIDSADRIVVAEYWAVQRLLSNGQPDTSFGEEEGLARIGSLVPGESDYAYTVATDASNRVIVGGITFLAGSPIDGQPFIVRFTSSGSPDSSFSGDGLVLGSQEGLVTDLIVDSSGRYLATGYSDELDMTHNVLIRYLPDGSFDTSFGGGFGFATVPFFADDVAIDKDQRIVVSGVGGSDIDFAAARYLSDITPPAGNGSQPGGGDTPPPSGQTPQPTPKPKALKCRKGFRKKMVRGKPRCVKIKKKRRNSR